MAKKKTSKKLHSYILLDRSGSMSTRWLEALNAINGHVDELDKGGTITVAAFDSSAFLLVRDNVTVKDFGKLTTDELQVGGMTPLYDSVGKLVELANKRDKKRTAITIITDGYENSSVEHTRDSARKLVEDCQKREWDVAFIGANFDNSADASSLGVSGGKTMAVADGMMLGAMRGRAAMTKSYAASGDSTIMYDSSLRAASGEHLVKGEAVDTVTLQGHASFDDKGEGSTRAA